MLSGKIDVKDKLAGICFFLSGCAGLIYEVCWIRKASLVFGSTIYALSTILAVFFLGLALGSYAFGRIAQRTERPLRLFAAMEFCVGVLAFGSLFAFEVVDRLYGVVYRAAGEQFVLLMLVRIGLISLVLLPPTILMGGTLPLFCRQYVDDDSRITRSVGFLYGLNTIGGAVGCAATGVYLLPSLGMFGAICTGVLLNIAVSLAVGSLGLRARMHTQAPGLESRSVRTNNQATVSVLFFLIGFVALGNEILWTRHLALLIQNTVYTYTLTLAVVLVGIVLGSFCAALYFDRSSTRAVWFGALQVATGLVVLGTMLIPADFWWRFDPLPLSTYFFLLLPPAVLSGAAFPLGVRMTVDDPKFASVSVGQLYAVNTIGGIAGSLMVGFVVLPIFGQQWTLLFMTGLSLAGGFVTWILVDQSLSPAVRRFAIISTLAVWLVVPFASGTRLPADFLVNSKTGNSLIAYREGLSSNLAVVQYPSGIKALEINRLWQGQDEKGHQIMAAHVPMLLRSDPHSVLLIGVGAGQTARRFLMYSIDRLDCIDIEPAVFDVIRRYFTSSWMDDRRVRLLREDGRNYLAHSRELYDVISIEVGQLVRPGVPFFYTSEFYKRAQERLTPGGFLVQFLPIPYFSVEQFRSALATFLNTFPQSFLWYNHEEMLLIGVKTPQLKLKGERLILLEGKDESENEVRHDLRISLVGDRNFSMHQRLVFLGSFMAGPNGLAHLSAGAPLYHDDRPVLDYAVYKVSRKDMNEIPIVALLREHLDPIENLIDLPLDNGERATIEQVRQKNLAFLVENAVRRNSR